MPNDKGDLKGNRQTSQFSQRQAGHIIFENAGDVTSSETEDERHEPTSKARGNDRIMIGRVKGCDKWCDIL